MEEKVSKESATGDDFEANTEAKGRNHGPRLLFCNHGKPDQSQPNRLVLLACKEEIVADWSVDCSEDSRMKRATPSDSCLIFRQ